MQRGLSLMDVVERVVPPEPWAEGDNIPWDDPGFSARMLREHLSDAHDLASRRGAVIDRRVAWLHDELLGGAPSRVLDLACGPGLYANRLAARGHACTGIDFAPASIEHAKRTAVEGATFVLGDLREAAFGEGYDLAMLIYGQVNVFRREEASGIFRRARESLAPGGRLLLEPQTEALVRRDEGTTTGWTTETSGLFSDRPYVLLEERSWSEPARAATERWHVIDAASGSVERHAMTTVAYSEAELTEALRHAGFAEVEHRPGLAGSRDDRLWAVIAS